MRAVEYLTRASSMSRRPLFLLLSLLVASHAEEEETIPDLTVSSLSELTMQNDKVIVLIYATGCERAAGFLPTLQRIAGQVKGLPFAQLNEQRPSGQLSKGSGVSSGIALGVEVGKPALKALFRNAPPDRRVLEYHGFPTYELVLEWAKAVNEWDGSDALPRGFEVGGRGGPAKAKTEL